MYALYSGRLRPKYLQVKILVIECEVTVCFHTVPSALIGFFLILTGFTGSTSIDQINILL